MVKLHLFLTVIIVSIVKNEGARILAVFPVPSISHQVVFRPLIQELAKRGHDVIVITPDPVFKKGQTPSNLTEIDVHDFSYEIWRKEVLSGDVTSGDKDDLIIQLGVAMNTITKVFEKQLQTDEVKRLLQDESKDFDLLLLEACILPTLGLTHRYKAPVIQISSFGAFADNVETIGAPTHPLVYPTSLRQRVYNLTKWERLLEFYNYYRLEKVLTDIENEADKMLRRIFGPDIPELRELKNNVDMLFLNVHPIWEMNRPYPPNVIFMGGLHQKKEKELPKELKSYLDSSKNGVIYVSFGTNIEPALLPPERLRVLTNVFSSLPFDILWKWNKDELPGRTANIKISKWLPQSDLLKHPKVKLFITQGGLQSTDEAITAGIPLIGIPMLGDQWYNVEQYEHHKIGLRIDMDTISEENLRNAVNTIIKDERYYRQNVAKLRSVMRDQPETPLERAVWWTEYVIRHGGARQLRAPSANISMTEYYELELVIYLLLASLSVVSVLVFIIYFLFNLRRQYNTEVKIKVN